MPKLTRRSVVKLAAGSAAGLVLGFHLPPREARALETPNDFGSFLNAWLRIAPDDTVTVIVDRAEMGQGVYTALPMLLAEDLGCEWSRVRVVAAPADPVYRNVFLVKEMLSGGQPMGNTANWLVGKLARLFGQQVTGGSSSVRGAYKPLRIAGATARGMLIAAAARRWGVPESECRGEAGVVSHLGGERRLTYGALAAEAAGLRPPKRPNLKQPNEWRLIGQPLPRLDLPAKVDGSAGFGIDVRVQGMLFAAVAACPVFGGTLGRHDPARALAMPGVKAVLPLKDALAVLADNTWRAQQALAAVEIEWTDPPGPLVDSAAIEASLRAALDETGRIAEESGDVAKALAGSVRRLRADYEVPYLAHAAMEPINATARVMPDGVDLWIPTQAQEISAKAAAEAAGTSTDKVRVHTTYLGGGFGRRSEADIATQAVSIAKLAGAPVQVVWSRAEDMRHDFYRPAAACRLEAGLDADGRLLAWQQRLASPSILARIFPPATWIEPDGTAVEGAVKQPYAIANRRVSHTVRSFPVPVGFWRSVGHSYTAFFNECFIDEAAEAAGKDPLAFRLGLLGEAPRQRAVLELAAAKASWGTSLPPGRGRGIALHSSFGSHVALVAEVLVDATGLSVVRVVAAIDCGVIINPDTVAAQVEGSIVFGLTAALYGRISLEGGRVVEQGFDDYPMLKLSEMPVVELHMLESSELPGGVGEPVVPPVAPALCNAIFAATGKRIRRLPVTGQLTA